MASLTCIDSEKIKARRVKESPIHFECILRDIISYGEHKGSGRLITGEVVKIHIEEKYYDEGRIVYPAIGRGAGNDWIKTDSKIQLERLMVNQIQK